MQEKLSQSQRHTLGLICILACALVACHVLWLPRILIDDAFISFRYARHLIEAQGLTFNPPQRVEGYSNFLWVLLMAAGLLGKLDPIAWSRSLGAAALFGSTIVAIYLTRRLVRSNAAAIAVALILAASTALCGSAICGLETGLYTLLVTAVTACVIFRRDLSASLLMGLAALTRPEGAGLCIIAIVTIALFQRDRLTSKRVARLFLPCGMILTALLTFRLLYFGQWFPNSVAAKSAMLPMLKESSLSDWPGILLNKPGLDYCLTFLRYTFGGLVLFAGVPILRDPRRRAIALYILATVAMGLAVALYNFGDWMTSFRLLTPYLPILTILVVWGMTESLSALRTLSPHLRKTPGRIVIAALVLVCGTRQFQRIRPPTAQSPDLELADALNASHQPGLLAATDVLGRLGYYADRVPIIDMAGLADAHIAKYGSLHPPLGRSDFQYVLTRKPHLIMNNVRAAWSRRLAYSAFAQNYWWVDRPSWTQDSGRLKQPRYVFVRRDSLLATEFHRRYPDATFRPPIEIAQNQR